MAMKSLWACLVGGVVLLAGAPAWAAQLLPYEGWLEHNGLPVDGVHDLSFRVLDAATDGTLLWEEHYRDVNRMAADGPGVLVSAGRFAVLLGQYAPFPATLWATRPLYLEIAVDGGSPLAGRQLLGGAPYAYNTDVLAVDVDALRQQLQTTRDDLQAAVQMLQASMAASSIVDRAASANDGWVKFGDGTLWYWYRGSRSHNTTYSFPTAFSAPPACTLSPVVNAMVSGGFYSVGTTTYMPHFAGGGTFDVGITCMGRWR